MQEVTNVGHAPFKTGDLYRSKDDGNDYILHTITQLTNDVILITGISVFTYKLKSWHDSKSTTFQSQVRRILINKNNISPQERLNMVRRSLEAATNNDVAILTATMEPKNQIIRDMLYFAEQADPKGMKVEFIRIAESLIYFTGSPINHSELRDVLMELSANSEVDPEFIEDVVRRVKEGSTFVKTDKITTVPSNASYRGLLKNALKLNENNGKSSFGTFRRNIKSRYSFSYNSKLSDMDRKIFERDILNERHPAFNNMPVSEGRSIEKKLATYIQTMFNAQDNPESIDPIVTKLVDDSVKNYKRGRKNFVIASLIDSVLDNPDDSEVNSTFIRTQKRRIEDYRNPYSYMQSQYVKRNIASTTQDLSMYRTRVNIVKLANMDNTLKSGQNRLLSIDMPTFYTKALEGAKEVTYNSKTYNYNILSQRKQLIEDIGERSSLIIPPSALRQARSTIADGRNLNLSFLFGLDNNIRKNLSSDTLQSLEYSHAIRDRQGKLIFNKSPVREIRYTGDQIGTHGAITSRNIMYGAEEDLNRTLANHSILSDISSSQSFLKSNGIEDQQMRLFAVMGEDENVYASTKIEQLDEYLKLNKIKHRVGTHLQHAIVPENDSDFVGFMDSPGVLSGSAQRKLLGSLENINPETVPLQNLFKQEDIARATKLGLDLRTPEGIRAYLGANTSIKTTGTFRAVTIGVPKSSHSSVEEAYEEGVHSSKMALVNFKEKGVSTLLASDSTIGVGSQVELFKEYYAKGGVVLDIEDYSGSTFIREFSYQKLHNVEGTLEASKSSSFYFTRTGMPDAKRLTGPAYENKFVNSLERLIKDMEHESVIVTQGQTDLEKILHTVSSFTSIDEDKKRSLMHSITYLIENKAVDMQVVAQVAGESYTNQQSLMKTVLGLNHRQPHTSGGDVDLAVQIMNKLKHSFLDNISSAEFIKSDKEAQSLDLIFGEINNYSSTKGRIKKLIGIRESISPTGDVSYIHSYEDLHAHINLNGTSVSYEPSGVFSTQQFTSSALARTMETGQVKLNSSSVEEVKMLQGFQEDRFERNFRAILNPTTETVVSKIDNRLAETEDSLHRYTGPNGANGVRGPVIMHDLLAQHRASSVFNEAKAEFDDKIEQIKAFGLKKDVQIDARNIAQEISEKYFGNEAKDVRSKAQLFLMLTDSDEQAMLMSPRSSVHKLMSNKIGHQLLEYAEQEDGNSFILFSHTLNAVLGDNVADGTTSLTPKSYGARLHVNFMGSSKTQKLGTLQDINKISTIADQLSSETLARMAAFQGEQSTSIREFLSNDLGLNLKRIDAQFRKLGAKTQELEEYKNLLASIQHGDPKDKDVGYLVHAMQVVSNSSKMKESFVTSFRERIDKTEGDVKAAGQRILDKALVEHNKGQKFTYSLEEQIKESISMGSTKLDQDSSVFKFFEDVRSNQVSPHEYIEAFGKHELVDEVVKRRNVFETLAETPGALKSVLATAAEAQREAARNGLEGIESQSLFGRVAFAEAKDVLNKQGLNATEIMNGNTLHLSTLKLQHEAMNKAAAKVNGVAVSEDAVRAAHSALNADVAKAYKIESIKAAVVPFLFVAGMMAQHPIEEDGFVEGKQSEKSASYVSRAAEIPGSNNGAPNQVWHGGDTSPFRLDITFSGFVESKEHHDQLMDKVYNAISTSIDTTKVQSRTRDLRTDRTRQRARDMMNL